jgi:hypothetical protein
MLAGEFTSVEEPTEDFEVLAVAVLSVDEPE